MARNASAFRATPVSACRLCARLLNHLGRLDLVADNLDLASLRREKDDVSEVREGFECGLVLRNYSDIKEGDVVEAFELRKIPRS